MKTIKTFLKKGDLYLFVLFMILMVVSFYLNSTKRSKGKSVEISINNELVNEFSLSKDCEFDVHCPDGIVRVKIENEKMWILSSTCPHKLCIKTGKIYKKGDVIICVPNRIVAKISGSKNDDVDGITM